MYYQYKKLVASLVILVAVGGCTKLYGEYSNPNIPDEKKEEQLKIDKDYCVTQSYFVFLPDVLSYDGLTDVEAGIVEGKYFEALSKAESTRRGILDKCMLKKGYEKIGEDKEDEEAEKDEEGEENEE